MTTQEGNTATIMEPPAKSFLQLIKSWFPWFSRQPDSPASRNGVVGEQLPLDETEPSPSSDEKPAVSNRIVPIKNPGSYTRSVQTPPYKIPAQSNDIAAGDNQTGEPERAEPKRTRVSKLVVDGPASVLWFKRVFMGLGQEEHEKKNAKKSAAENYIQPQSGAQKWLWRAAHFGIGAGARSIGAEFGLAAGYGAYAGIIEYNNHHLTLVEAYNKAVEAEGKRKVGPEPIFIFNKTKFQKAKSLSQKWAVVANSRNWDTEGLAHAGRHALSRGGLMLGGMYAFDQLSDSGFLDKAKGYFSDLDLVGKAQGYFSGLKDTAVSSWNMLAGGANDLIEKAGNVMQDYFDANKTEELVTKGPDVAETIKNPLPVDYDGDGIISLDEKLVHMLTPDSGLNLTTEEKSLVGETIRDIPGAREKLIAAFASGTGNFPQDINTAIELAKNIAPPEGVVATELAPETVPQEAATTTVTEPLIMPILDDFKAFGEGEYAKDGGLTDDVVKNVELAKTGDAEAMENLATHFENGTGGVAQDKLMAEIFRGDVAPLSGQGMIYPQGDLSLDDAAFEKEIADLDTQIAASEARIAEIDEQLAELRRKEYGFENAVDGDCTMTASGENRYIRTCKKSARILGEKYTLELP